LDNSQMDDSVFDTLFRQAIVDNFYEELDSLPPDEELSKQYNYSVKHEKRMKQLFEREARKDRLRATLNVGKRLVAIIAIAVSILFGALMSMPQIRAVVVNTIVEWFDEFARFTSNAPVVEPIGMSPTYIPDGFWEEFRDESYYVTTILYLNESGEIIMFQSSRAIGAFYVDNEDATHELRVINGNEYHILAAIELNQENSIIWDVGGWRYLIRSTITVESLQKMAISVE